MKKRRVLSASSLQPRSPLLATIVAWLLLDRLAAPGWAWGVTATLIAFVWIGCIYRWVTDETADAPGFGDLPEERKF